MHSAQPSLMIGPSPRSLRFRFVNGPALNHTTVEKQEKNLAEMKKMREAQRHAGAGGRRMLDEVDDYDDAIEEGQAIMGLEEDVSAERGLLEQDRGQQVHPRLEGLIASTKIKLPRPFR